MTDPQRRLFCFGLGYSALRLARRLAGEGWHVCGTVRGEEKAERLRAEGIEALLFDGTARLTPPTGAHWLISIPPGPDGCPAFHAAGAAAGAAASVTYLSTTGVYGDLGGGWAFEWTPTNPGTERARQRIRAEAQWLSTPARGVNLVRLPGIYGPGRSAFDRLRAGTARRVIKPGQVFSRIHVDDIGTGLEAVFAARAARRVVHLTDDEPAPPQDVIACAADLLGVSPPLEVAFDAADLSAMARSFYSECKRVSNARTKAELGWRPTFATYREGLEAIFKEETGL